MTTPNAAETPVARYQVEISMVAEDKTVATDRFHQPSEAREWTRRYLRVQGDSSVTVTISDTVAQPHLEQKLYALTGSAGQVARALEDDRAPVVAEALESGVVFDAAAEFAPMVQLYEQATAEAARVPSDTALAEKRNSLRSDLTLTVDRLIGSDHHRAAARVTYIDLIPMARPHGAFTAVLESSTGNSPGPQAADLATHPLALRVQQFDSGRHAREFLRAHCEMLDETTGPVKAFVVQQRPDGTTATLRSETGAPAEVAAALKDQVDYDGTLITGVAGTDRDLLARLVEEYEDAATDAPVFQPVAAGAQGAADARRQLAPSRYSRLGTEIAEMLADPRLADQISALRPVLAAADRFQARGPNAVSSTVGCPSSGFVQADLQIALDQHHLLMVDMLEADRPMRRQIAAQASEILRRIDAMLPNPLLTATERVAVLDDVRQAIETPTKGYEPVFEMPMPAVIRQRADELLDAPPRSGPGMRGRDVDDALRLYQLTRIAADEGFNPERDALRLTILDQRIQVEARIQDHPHLNSGEKAALRATFLGLGHDPYQRIPTQRAEHVAAPIPTERMMPPAPDTVDRYTIGFEDARTPGREFVIRADGDRWTVQAYRGYEAHPQWRLSEGAAEYPDVSAMLSALHGGAQVATAEGGRRRLDPVPVPGGVRELAGHAERIRKAHGSGSGSDPSRAAAPQAATARYSGEQRRKSMLHRPPQSGGRHRKIG
ncbi:hypothetical protein ACFWPH_28120 [Nocardia sp. NPDC058499]|uniref:hypothetical protein n=1 Tax=Nocardia sp. NPDC058499 TaxID=3346530 RepID=UPI003666F8B6